MLTNPYTYPENYLLLCSYKINKHFTVNSLKVETWAFVFEFLALRMILKHKESCQYMLRE